MSDPVPKEEEDDEGEEEEEEEEKKDIDSPSNDAEPETSKSSALTKTQPSYGHAGVQEENKIKDDPKTPATAKKYRFEDLDPLHKSIFCPKSKSLRAEERFKMSAQEYLDTFKVTTILQDAFKTILDRRGENAKTIFVQYLDSALKGDHILLREHAFVNATPLNRK